MAKWFTLFFCLLSASCGSGLQYEHPTNPKAPQFIHSITPVAPGNTCQYGGNLISMGSDANADGLLDDDEINLSKTLCNEKQGIIIQQTADATLEQCPLGGVTIIVGMDSNGDGIIDNPNSTSSYSLCNTTTSLGKPLISVTYVNTDLCLGGQTTIKNITDKPVNLTFISNNIYPTAIRNIDSLPYYGEQEMPLSLQPAESIYTNLNIQPDKEGEIDVSYALHTSNSAQKYTFADTAKCYIGDKKVSSFQDIINLRFDYYISSYKGNPSKQRQCQVGAKCMLGFPFGIRKGLYPLYIEIDWGDGNMDSIHLRNIGMHPFIGHTFLEKGLFPVHISIKASNMATPLKSSIISVTVD